MFSGFKTRVSILALWVTFLGAHGARAFYSKDSTEAVLTFHHFIEFGSKKPPTEEQAKSAIGAQLKFLFGPLMDRDDPAVPKMDGILSKIEITEFKKNHYRAEYDYEGTVLVTVKDGKAPTELKFPLPMDPENLFELSATEKDGALFSFCDGDAHDPVDTFSYDWDPEREGCRNKEGKDYLWVTGKLNPRPSTAKTYPEYSRLVDSNREITAMILVGMDQLSEGGVDPLKSEDAIAPTYQEMRAMFVNELGYSARSMTKNEVTALFYPEAAGGAPKHNIPRMEEFLLTTPRGKIRIRMAFTPSAVAPENRPFVHLFRNGLENASIVLYDGHSGFGKYDNLTRLETQEKMPIQPARERYQIYMFNSCSSYAYYDLDFFSRKGTRNLNILTKALPTGMVDGRKSDQVFLRAVTLWATEGKMTSYQEIIDQGDANDLFSVEGDEDNPSEPQG